MFPALRRQNLLLGLLFLVLLLNGCAGTTTSRTAETTSPTAVESPKDSVDYQRALQAYEDHNFKQAVELFRVVRKSYILPDSDLYYFAKSLYQTEEYAEAITIYTQYLEKLGRRGVYFLTALDERNAASEKYQQQQAAEAKAAKAETAFKQLATSLEANWLVVKVQVDNRVASFKEPLTGMEMLLVSGGCYQMGGQSGTGESNELPVHQVCVDDFYLGKYEVTQAQWQLLMGYNPSTANQGDNFPVDTISWQEATEFARKLGGETDRYRLPTEAEWEYAARSGGKDQLFSGSNSVDAVAWHEDNSAGSSHPVGQKQANGLGFHDMSGNAYEWCFDRYAEDYYAQSPQENPTGPATGTERTRRGGSWDSETSYSRTSYRTEGHETDYRADKSGFRLALPLTD